MEWARVLGLASALETELGSAAAMELVSVLVRAEVMDLGWGLMWEAVKVQGSAVEWATASVGELGQGSAMGWGSTLAMGWEVVTVAESALMWEWGLE
jgi:hypothetical protein